MKSILLFTALGLVIVGYFLKGRFTADLSSQPRRSYSLSDRLEQFGKVARDRWQPYFTKAQITYPSSKLLFVGLKAEMRLEVYALQDNGPWALLRSFDICAGSGVKGPKLQEGDRQVPEGVYRISALNPNSKFHLSLSVNYPNDFDREKGRLDGREDLGGDIMIHGDCVSIGCLAMGDEAAEDLFVLAADIGIQNIKVILAPFDFRTRELVPDDYDSLPDWTPELYGILKREFKELGIS